MLAIIILVFGLISSTTSSPDLPVREQLADSFALLDARFIDISLIKKWMSTCEHLACTLGIDLVEAKVRPTNLVFHMARTLGNICKHFQSRESVPTEYKDYDVLRTQVCELWSIVSKLRQLIN